MAVLFVAGLLVFARTSGTASLWSDEAWQVWYGLLPVRTIVALLPQNDTSPPLYYIVLHAWIALLGPSAFSVRFLSILCAALAVPLLYGFMLRWRIAAGWCAALASAVVIANPFYAAYSREARPYAFMALLALCATWCVVAWVASARRTWAILLVLADTALLYTQSTTALLILTQGLYLALMSLRQRDASARRALQALWPLLAAIALWLPWVPAFRLQVQHDFTAWIPLAHLADLQQLVLLMMGLLNGQSLPHGHTLRYVVEIVFAAGVLLCLRAGWRDALLLLAATIPFYLLATHVHLWATRALLFTVFGFALLLARLIGRLPRLLGVALVTAVVVVGVSAPIAPKAPWRPLAATLCRDAQGGDVLAVSDSYVLPPLAYYTTADACPTLRLTPIQTLPHTRDLFLRDIFSHGWIRVYRPAGMVEPTDAWDIGQAQREDVCRERRLAARHVEMWFVAVTANAPTALAQWEATSAFTFEHAPTVHFAHDELLLASARIDGVRAPRLSCPR